jgi:hypothetical protein
MQDRLRLSCSVACMMAYIIRAMRRAVMTGYLKPRRGVGLFPGRCGGAAS